MVFFLLGDGEIVGANPEMFRITKAATIKTATVHLVVGKKKIELASFEYKPVTVDGGYTASTQAERFISHIFTVLFEGYNAIDIRDILLTMREEEETWTRAKGFGGAEDT